MAGFADLWGGLGFGGLGGPGAVPAGGDFNYAAPGATGGPQQTIPGLQPGVTGGVDANRDFSYAAPGTTGGPQQTMGASQPPPPPNLWDRLMNAVGQSGLANMKMPGTTIGAPAGQTAPPIPPMMLPQGQMPRPPGIAALQQPAAPSGGNNALLAQYMALQQLMRGS